MCIAAGKILKISKTSVKVVENIRAMSGSGVDSLQTQKIEQVKSANVDGKSLVGGAVEEKGAEEGEDDADRKSVV